MKREDLVFAIGCVSLASFVVVALCITLGVWNP